MYCIIQFMGVSEEIDTTKLKKKFVLINIVKNIFMSK